MNSYNPKISNKNAPEIPGKNIALIATKPPKKTYNKVGFISIGIRIANKVPMNNPIMPNKIFLR